MKLPIITLCGSRKFIGTFRAISRGLTLSKYVVLTPAIFDHDIATEPSPDEIEIYHMIHYQKMRMSDIIIVISIDGYIGKDTQREIDYADELGLPILYINKIDDLINEESSFNNKLSELTKQFYNNLKEDK